MDPIDPGDLSKQDYYSLILAFLTVGCGLLVIRAFARGSSLIQIILLSALTVYALSATLDRFSAIPQLKRLTAIPLGIVGVLAYLIGAPTDLPIFFVLLGIAGAIDLIWDPTGDIYRDTDN